MRSVPAEMIDARDRMTSRTPLAAGTGTSSKYVWPLSSR
jgi:hypothetical protein